MTRAEKEAYIAQLIPQLTQMKAALFTEYRGTTVAQLEQLRNTLFPLGITFHVAKNSLVKRALDQVGFQIDNPLIFDSPLAIAMTDQDEVTLAKALVSTDIESIKPVAGIINGKFMTGRIIQTLADLPPRQEMYAKIVGSLSGLPTRMVRTLANPLRILATGLYQYKMRKEQL